MKKFKLFFAFHLSLFFDRCPKILLFLRKNQREESIILAEMVDFFENFVVFCNLICYNVKNKVREDRNVIFNVVGAF